MESINKERYKSVVVAASTDDVMVAASMLPYLVGKDVYLMLEYHDTTVITTSYQDHITYKDGVIQPSIPAGLPTERITYWAMSNSPSAITNKIVERFYVRENTNK